MSADEMMGKVWPDYIAQQLVGWMKLAAKNNNECRREMECFAKSLSRKEELDLERAARL